MQKEKSIGRNILIVVLILVTIASVCAGLFAWAKYQTTINGTATGETAKWSFKVSDGDTSTQEIELPMTRTDSNSSVVEGKIAPGTYGELQIGIDATGTETALTYVIEATMQNKPTNMKFYSDAERTQELTILDNKFSKGGYMKLNEAGARTEKIYWEWPFETVTCPAITDEKLSNLGIDKVKYETLIAEKKFSEANDMLDTAESDMQVSMKVSVTGKQLNGNPVLADLVQVGDYVNYNAASGEGVDKSYTPIKELTGTAEGINTFNSSDIFNSETKAQWRVLSIDSVAGTVELISVEPTAQTVKLLGAEGFVNAKTVLNNIGSIYGQGKGASSGRSIKLEDIEQYSSYVPSIGGTQEYTSGNFYKEEKDSKENVTGYETTVTVASNSNTVTMTLTQYNYSAQNYFSNLTIYNMFFKNSISVSSNKSTYWLATQCVEPRANYCNFNVRRVFNGTLSDNALYGSNDGKDTHAFKVVPVVSLNANIKTTGQDGNGVWQLDV